MTTQALQP